MSKRKQGRRFLCLLLTLSLVMGLAAPAVAVDEITTSQVLESGMYETDENGNLVRVGDVPEELTQLPADGEEAPPEPEAAGSRIELQEGRLVQATAESLALRPELCAVCGENHIEGNCALASNGVRLLGSGGEWDGATVDTSWYLNDPTAERYELSTPEQLAGLALLVGKTIEGTGTALDGTAVTMAGQTIALPEGAQFNMGGYAWRPIGLLLLGDSGTAQAQYMFQGTFEGNGSTVSGLNLTAWSTLGVALTARARNMSVSAGFFGALGENATVENVKLVVENGEFPLMNMNWVDVNGDPLESGEELTRHFYAGGLSGYAATNAAVDGVSVEITGEFWSETGTEEAGTSFQNAYMGGLVGYLAADAAVSGSFVEADGELCDLSGRASVGGVAGYAESAWIGYSSAKLHGYVGGGAAGGLVGRGSGVTVENSYVWFSGEGRLSGDYAGLLFGSLSDGSVYGAYAADWGGHTFGGTGVSGLIAGVGSGSSITGVYLSSATGDKQALTELGEDGSGNSITQCKKGLTLEQLRTESVCNVFDFQNTWQIAEKDKYLPQLKGLEAPQTYLMGQLRLTSTAGESTLVQGDILSVDASGVHLNAVVGSDVTYRWSRIDRNGVSYSLDNDGKTSYEIKAADDGYTIQVTMEAAKGATAAIANSLTAESSRVNVTSLWEDLADESWYRNDPEAVRYELYDGFQLAGLATLVSSGVNFAEKTIALGTDIDLSGMNWTPIGGYVLDEAKSFSGVFDGQGHRILGMNVDKTYDDESNTAADIASGAFSYLNGGTIKNLHLEVADIQLSAKTTGRVMTAPLVGYVGAGSTIEHCYVTASGMLSAVNRLTEKDESVADPYSGTAVLSGMVAWTAMGDGLDAQVTVKGCSVTLVEGSKLVVEGGPSSASIGGVVAFCGRGTTISGCEAFLGSTVQLKNKNYTGSGWSYRTNFSGLTVGNSLSDGYNWGQPTVENCRVVYEKAFDITRVTVGGLVSSRALYFYDVSGQDTTDCYSIFWPSALTQGAKSKIRLGFNALYYYTELEPEWSGTGCTRLTDSGALKKTGTYPELAFTDWYETDRWGNKTLIKSQGWKPLNDEVSYPIPVALCEDKPEGITLSGKNWVGQTLRASMELESKSATYTMRWYRDGKELSTALGEESYALTEEDLGGVISARALVTNREQGTYLYQDYTSAATERVTASNLDGAVTIEYVGEAQEAYPVYGDKLTVNTSAVTPAELRAGLTFLWYRTDRATGVRTSTGATGQSYIVSDADANCYLSVTATAPSGYVGTFSAQMPEYVRVPLRGAPKFTAQNGNYNGGTASIPAGATLVTEARTYNFWASDRYDYNVQPRDAYWQLKVSYAIQKAGEETWTAREAVNGDQYRCATTLEDEGSILRVTISTGLEQYPGEIVSYVGIGSGAVSGTLVATGTSVDEETGLRVISAGDTLYADNSKVMPEDARSYLSYTWYRDSIEGEVLGTGSNYTTTPKDIGHNIVLVGKGTGSYYGTLQAEAVELVKPISVNGNVRVKAQGNSAYDKPAVTTADVGTTLLPNLTEVYPATAYNKAYSNLELRWVRTATDPVTGEKTVSYPAGDDVWYQVKGISSTWWDPQTVDGLPYTVTNADLEDQAVLTLELRGAKGGLLDGAAGGSEVMAQGAINVTYAEVQSQRIPLSGLLKLYGNNRKTYQANDMAPQELVFTADISGLNINGSGYEKDLTYQWSLKRIDGTAVPFAEGVSATDTVSPKLTAENLVDETGDLMAELHKNGGYLTLTVAVRDKVKNAYTGSFRTSIQLDPAALSGALLVQRAYTDADTGAAGSESLGDGGRISAGDTLTVDWDKGFQTAAGEVEFTDVHWYIKRRDENVLEATYGYTEGMSAAEKRALRKAYSFQVEENVEYLYVELTGMGDYVNSALQRVILYRTTQGENTDLGRGDQDAMKTVFGDSNFVVASAGDGVTEYYIATEAGLQDFRDLVNGDLVGVDGLGKEYPVDAYDFTGKTVYLMKDLTLTAENWTGLIGSNGHPFKGTFAGQGHSIDLPAITSLDAAGKSTNPLFTQVDAPSYTIRGLRLNIQGITLGQADAPIQGNVTVGGLMAELPAGITLEKVSVTYSEQVNIYATGDVILGGVAAVTAGDMTGGGGAFARNITIETSGSVTMGAAAAVVNGDLAGATGSFSNILVRSANVTLGGVAANVTGNVSGCMGTITGVANLQNVAGTTLAGGVAATVGGTEVSTSAGRLQNALWAVAGETVLGGVTGAADGVALTDCGGYLGEINAKAATALTAGGLAGRGGTAHGSMGILRGSFKGAEETTLSLGALFGDGQGTSAESCVAVIREFSLSGGKAGASNVGLLAGANPGSYRMSFVLVPDETKITGVTLAAPAGIAIVSAMTKEAVAELQKGGLPSGLAAEDFTKESNELPYLTRLVDVCGSLLNLASNSLVGRGDVNDASAGETDWNDLDPNAEEYNIINLTQLLAFREAVAAGNDFTGKKVSLRTSIDTEGMLWAPIGTAEKPFRGTFDGKGFQIRNLVLRSESADAAVGFFGELSGGAVLQDVRIMVQEIATASPKTGALVGSLGETGTVSGCAVTLLSSGAGYTSSAAAVGVAIGQVDNGSVSGCTIIVPEGAAIRLTGTGNTSFGLLTGNWTAGSVRSISVRFSGTLTAAGNLAAGGIAAAQPEGQMLSNAESTWGGKITASGTLALGGLTAGGSATIESGIGTVRDLTVSGTAVTLGGLATGAASLENCAASWENVTVTTTAGDAVLGGLATELTGPASICTGTVSGLTVDAAGAVRLGGVAADAQGSLTGCNGTLGGACKLTAGTTLTIGGVAAGMAEHVTATGCVARLDVSGDWTLAGQSALVGALAGTMAATAKATDCGAYVGGTFRATGVTDAFTLGGVSGQGGDLYGVLGILNGNLVCADTAAVHVGGLFGDGTDTKAASCTAGLRGFTLSGGNTGETQVSAGTLAGGSPADAAAYSGCFVYVPSPQAVTLPSGVELASTAGTALEECQGSGAVRALQQKKDLGSLSGNDFTKPTGGVPYLTRLGKICGSLVDMVTDVLVGWGDVAEKLNGSTDWSNLPAEAQIYYIGSVGDLKAFREMVNSGNSFEGKKIYLCNDLDMGQDVVEGNPVAWTAIGNEAGTTFQGTFDGQNYTVSNLTLGDGAYVGLFGALSGGTVQNLKVSAKQVATTSAHTGILVGALSGTGVVSNCIVTLSAAGTAKEESGAYTSYSYTSSAATAGIAVGSMTGGSITACQATVEAGAAIQLTNTAAALGGLAGSVTGGTIENCRGTLQGDLFAAGALGVGGIAATMFDVALTNSEGAVSGSVTVDGKLQIGGITYESIGTWSQMTGTVADLTVNTASGDISIGGLSAWSRSTYTGCSGVVKGVTIRKDADTAAIAGHVTVGGITVMPDSTLVNCTGAVSGVTAETAGNIQAVGIAPSFQDETEGATTGNNGSVTGGTLTGGTVTASGAYGSVSAPVQNTTGSLSGVTLAQASGEPKAAGVAARGGVAYTGCNGTVSNLMVQGDLTGDLMLGGVTADTAASLANCTGTVSGVTATTSGAVLLGGAAPAVSGAVEGCSGTVSGLALTAADTTLGGITAQAQGGVSGSTGTVTGTNTLTGTVLAGGVAGTLAENQAVTGSVGTLDENGIWNLTGTATLGGLAGDATATGANVKDSGGYVGAAITTANAADAALTVGGVSGKGGTLDGSLGIIGGSVTADAFTGVTMGALYGDGTGGAAANCTSGVTEFALTGGKADGVAVSTTDGAGQAAPTASLVLIPDETTISLPEGAALVKPAGDTLLTYSGKDKYAELTELAALPEGLDGAYFTKEEGSMPYLTKLFETCGSLLDLITTGGGIGRGKLDALHEGTTTDWSAAGADAGSCFYINSVDDLKAFRDSVNNGYNYSGMTVYLCADIDLALDVDASNNRISWVPIGNNKSFNGTFDGQNHKIENLYTTGSDYYAGLFGKISNATLSNIQVRVFRIQATCTYVGGLVGYMDGTSKINGSTVIILATGTERNEDDTIASYSLSSSNTYTGIIAGFVNTSGLGNAATMNNCSAQTEKGTAIYLSSGNAEFGGFSGYFSYGSSSSDMSAENRIAGGLDGSFLRMESKIRGLLVINKVHNVAGGVGILTGNASLVDCNSNISANLKITAINGESGLAGLAGLQSGSYSDIVRCSGSITSSTFELGSGGSWASVGGLSGRIHYGGGYIVDSVGQLGTSVEGEVSVWDLNTGSYFGMGGALGEARTGLTMARNSLGYLTPNLQLTIKNGGSTAVGGFMGRTHGGGTMRGCLGAVYCKGNTALSSLGYGIAGMCGDIRNGDNVSAYGCMFVMAPQLTEGNAWRPRTISNVGITNSYNCLSIVPAEFQANTQSPISIDKNASRNIVTYYAAGTTVAGDLLYAEADVDRMKSEMLSYLQKDGGTGNINSRWTESGDYYFSQTADNEIAYLQRMTKENGKIIIGNEITLGGSDLTIDKSGGAGGTGANAEFTEGRITALFIHNLDELKAFRDRWNSDESFLVENIYLCADIDLATETDWVPIGTTDKPFNGRFNGQDYTLSNLTTNGTGGYAGLFGYVQDAAFENLQLTIYKIDTAQQYTGGLVGHATGSSTFAHIGVKLLGNYSTYNADGAPSRYSLKSTNTYVGLVAGRLELSGLAGKAAMTDCKAESEDKAAIYLGNNNVRFGGLVGEYNYNSATTPAEGTTEAELRRAGKTDGRIEDSLGRINGGLYYRCNYIGGAVGRMSGYGALVNTSGILAGALQLTPYSEIYLGGLVGEVADNNYADLTGCYGAILSPQVTVNSSSTWNEFGGLIGRMNAGNMMITKSTGLIAPATTQEGNWGINMNGRNVVIGGAIGHVLGDSAWERANQDSIGYLSSSLSVKTSNTGNLYLGGYLGRSNGGHIKLRGCIGVCGATVDAAGASTLYVGALAGWANTNWGYTLGAYGCIGWLGTAESPFRLTTAATTTVVGTMNGSTDWRGAESWGHYGGYNSLSLVERAPVLPDGVVLQLNAMTNGVTYYPAGDQNENGIYNDRDTMIAEMQSHLSKQQGDDLFYLSRWEKEDKASYYFAQETASGESGNLPVGDAYLPRLMDADGSLVLPGNAPGQGLWIQGVGGNPVVDIPDTLSIIENASADDGVESYYIYTLEDLKSFRDKVNGANGLTAYNFSGKTVYLCVDIDLTEDTDEQGAQVGWNPIGSSNQFSGTFDGLNHSIENLYLSGNAAYMGLFGRVNSGSLKNIQLTVSQVYANSKNVGCLVGYMDGASYIADSTITLLSGSTQRDVVGAVTTWGYRVDNGNFAGILAGKIAASGLPEGQPVLDNCLAQTEDGTALRIEGGNDLYFGALAGEVNYANASSNASAEARRAGNMTGRIESCYAQVGKGELRINENGAGINYIYAGGAVGMMSGYATAARSNGQLHASSLNKYSHSPNIGGFAGKVTGNYGDLTSCMGVITSPELTCRSDFHVRGGVGGLVGTHAVRNSYITDCSGTVAPEQQSNWKIDLYAEMISLGGLIGELNQDSSFDTAHWNNLGYVSENVLTHIVNNYRDTTIFYAGGYCGYANGTLYARSCIGSYDGKISVERESQDVTSTYVGGFTGYGNGNTRVNAYGCVGVLGENLEISGQSSGQNKLSTLAGDAAYTNLYNCLAIAKYDPAKITINNMVQTVNTGTNLVTFVADGVRDAENYVYNSSSRADMLADMLDRLQTDGGSNNINSRWTNTAGDYYFTQDVTSADIAYLPNVFTPDGSDLTASEAAGGSMFKDKAGNENLVEIPLNQRSDFANASASDGVENYYITCLEDLQAFRDRVNSAYNFSGKTVYLCADINLGNLVDGSGNRTSWVPIGNNKSFDGTFDGQNYTIKELYTTGSKYAGLFGRVYAATLKNLQLTVYRMDTGLEWAGGLVGVAENASTIANSTVTLLKDATVYNEDGTVKQYSWKSSHNYNGIIVGYLNTQNTPGQAAMTNCKAVVEPGAAIYLGSNGAAFGGLAGCYRYTTATADAKPTTRRAGEMDGRIENCLTQIDGCIYGKAIRTGGAVGYIDGYYSSIARVTSVLAADLRYESDNHMYIGGLVGEVLNSNYGDIVGCSGTVASAVMELKDTWGRFRQVGGIVGRYGNANGYFENCVGTIDPISETGVGEWSISGRDGSQLYLGGLAGCFVDNDHGMTYALRDNLGYVSSKMKITGKNGNYMYLGGLAGGGDNDNRSIVFRGCMGAFAGQVDASGTNYLYVGGLVGNGSKFPMYGCTGVLGTKSESFSVLAKGKTTTSLGTLSGKLGDLHNNLSLVPNEPQDKTGETAIGITDAASTLTLTVTSGGSIVTYLPFLAEAVQPEPEPEPEPTPEPTPENPEEVSLRNIVSGETVLDTLEKVEGAEADGVYTDLATMQAAMNDRLQTPGTDPGDGSTVMDEQNSWTDGDNVGEYYFHQDVTGGISFLPHILETADGGVKLAPEAPTATVNITAVIRMDLMNASLNNDSNISAGTVLSVDESKLTPESARGKVVYSWDVVTKTEDADGNVTYTKVAEGLHGTPNGGSYTLTGDDILAYTGKTEAYYIRVTGRLADGVVLNDVAENSSFTLVSRASIAPRKITGTLGITGDPGLNVGATAKPDLSETNVVSQEGLSYKWYLGDVAEDDAEAVPFSTEAEPVLPVGAYGQKLTLIATGLSEQGYEETTLRAVSAEVGPGTLNGNVAVTLDGQSGKLYIGGSVTAALTGFPTGIELTYQWYRVTADGKASAIAEATGAVSQEAGASLTYTAVMDDELSYLRCVISEPSGALSGTVHGTSGMQVEKEPVDGKVVISYEGILAPSAHLTATVSNVSEEQEKELTYQWYRVQAGAEAVPVGTGETYDAVAEDIGCQLMVEVSVGGKYTGSFSNSTKGTVEAAVFSGTAAVTVGEAVATAEGEPAAELVYGGQELTARFAIVDTDPETEGVQPAYHSELPLAGNSQWVWYRVDVEGTASEISRTDAATAEGKAAYEVDDATYTVTAEDIGYTIHAALEGTGLYSSSSAVSADTGRLVKQPGPAAPKIAAERLSGAATKGQITGLDAGENYAYRAQGATEWIAVAAGSATIPVDYGTYEVYIPATDTREASAAATVTLQKSIVEQAADWLAGEEGQGTVLGVGNSGWESVSEQLTLMDSMKEYPNVSFAWTAEADGTSYLDEAGKLVFPAEGGADVSGVTVKATLRYSLKEGDQGYDPLEDTTAEVTYTVTLKAPVKKDTVSDAYVVTVEPGTDGLKYNAGTPAALTLGKKNEDGSTTDAADELTGRQWTVTWYYGAGENWTEITGATSQTLKLDNSAYVGKYIKAELEKTGAEGAVSGVSTDAVAKGDQAAPVGLRGTAPTGVDTTDGKITGLNKALTYEYRQKDERPDSETAAADWTQVTGETELADQAVGSYLVRLVETEIYETSPSAEVAVPMNYKARAQQWLGDQFDATMKNENADKDNIKYDLTLPTQVAVPEYNTYNQKGITWTVDGEGAACLGTDGTVSRPTDGTGKTVTLTATVKLDESDKDPAVVTYELTILPLLPLGGSVKLDLTSGGTAVADGWTDAHAGDVLAADLSGVTVSGAAAELDKSDFTFSWYAVDGKGQESAIANGGKDSYTVKASDIGKSIGVRVTAKGISDYVDPKPALSVQMGGKVLKNDQAAPDYLLAGVDESDSSEQNGSITNFKLNVGYEWILKSTLDGNAEAAWTAFTPKTAEEGTLKALTGGEVYCVRLAETDTHYASPATELTIPKSNVSILVMLDNVGAEELAAKHLRYNLNVLKADGSLGAPIEEEAAMESELLELSLSAGTYRLEFLGDGYLPYVVILEELSPEKAEVDPVIVTMTRGKVDKDSFPYSVTMQDRSALMGVLDRYVKESDKVMVNSDFNSDGRVDVTDLGVVLESVGKSSSGLPIGKNYHYGDQIIRQAAKGSEEGAQ